MRHLSGSPFCGRALNSLPVPVLQPREFRRAFRHESVAPQRIRVAIACPTSVALPSQHVVSVTIDLRDNQKAYPGSLARDRQSVTREARACKRLAKCIATTESVSLCARMEKLPAFAEPKLGIPGSPSFTHHGMSSDIAQA